MWLSLINELPESLLGLCLAGAVHVPLARVLIGWWRPSSLNALVVPALLVNAEFLVWYRISSCRGGRGEDETLDFGLSVCRF